MSGKIHKTAFLIASVGFLFLFNGYLLCAASAAVIKGETIKAHVKTYIENNMSWPKSVVRVEFPTRVSDLKLTGEKITYRVLSRRNEDFMGNSSFTVRCYENGTFLNATTVRARIEVLMDVVVSAKSLHRNTRINRDDVRLVKRWFSRLPSNIISSHDAVVGMKLRTNVKPNAEITGNMVRSIPMVKRGKPVRIVFENGPMRITTIGLSEQDGMHGELIKVRNVSSKNMIYARVTGNSLVKVEF
ncbi:MAG: flagellar basal body P-ring formation chaperone FlgA [Spirochaetales bacterium]|jgi:flagella basal body P-ring formation protein FlgA|nr:flagellar basal body P-ring formation chaperone FlgA [Spirochaetales bacterium]